MNKYRRDLREFGFGFSTNNSGLFDAIIVVISLRFNTKGFASIRRRSTMVNEFINHFHWLVTLCETEAFLNKMTERYFRHCIECGIEARLARDSVRKAKISLRFNENIDKHRPLGERTTFHDRDNFSPAFWFLFTRPKRSTTIGRKTIGRRSGKPCSPSPFCWTLYA